MIWNFTIGWVEYEVEKSEMKTIGGGKPKSYFYFSIILYTINTHCTPILCTVYNYFVYDL